MPRFIKDWGIQSTAADSLPSHLQDIFIALYKDVACVHLMRVLYMYVQAAIGERMRKREREVLSSVSV